MSDLVIIHNDLPDSDNWIAAKVLLKHFMSANTRIIWIVEPHQVALGLYMPEEQQRRCRELIERYFPEKGRPFKVLLTGSLTREEIEKTVSDREDRELLFHATKPEDGSKADARLHARCTALDFADYLSSLSETGVTVFVDIDCLTTNKQPINSHMHHHEELVLRTPEEIRQWQDIMQASDKETREAGIRKWYDECSRETDGRLAARGTEVSDLNFDKLCDQIKASNRVQFYGGASAGILRRLLVQADVAGRMECCLQLGAFDLTQNLFRNQFNIELNAQDAKYVLENSGKFKQFCIVPSDTVRRAKYRLSDLCLGDPILEKHLLAYNLRQDPREPVAKERLGLEAFTMPDLTAFLCSLKPGFCGSTLGRAVFIESGDQLLMTEAAEGTDGVQVYVNGDGCEDFLLEGERLQSLLMV